MSRFLIVGFVLFAFGGTAFAADLPRRQPVVQNASVGQDSNRQDTNRQDSSPDRNQGLI